MRPVRPCDPRTTPKALNWSPAGYAERGSAWTFAASGSHAFKMHLKHLKRSHSLNFRVPEVMVIGSIRIPS